MEDQIEQAVTILYDGRADASLKQEALNFCQQVKSSSDGWQLCLGLFSAGKSRSSTARFFALQVVGEALATRGSDLGDGVLLIKDQLLGYVSENYIMPPEPIDDPHFRNKIAQIFSYIILICYPSKWPSCFDNLLEMAQAPEYSNANGIDFYLRVLSSLHEEIGDTLINRSTEDNRRASLIKDNIREASMSQLTASWMYILQVWSNNSSPKALDLCDFTLRTIGSWVSWIDINLIVTPEYMNLIFALLAREKINGTACNTLAEIISKKMMPANKLSLISLLNIIPLLSQLKIGSDIEFDERVAHLCNVIARELLRIMDMSSNEPSLCSSAQQQLFDLTPFLLEFLGNEYDDTSTQIFPSITEYLNYLRKIKSQNAFPDQASSILSQMLTVIISKAKYDESTDWTGGEDGSESEFLDIRARLRIFQDSIAAIDYELVSRMISELVFKSLDTPPNSWRDLELALFELWAYGEGLRNAGILSKTQRDHPTISVLQNCLSKMISSDIVLNYAHPAVQLQFMELIVRHQGLIDFDVFGLRILQFFVSEFGAHNSNKKVQARAWYLLLQFIKHSAGYFSASEAKSQLLSGLQDLFVIEAGDPPTDNDSSSLMSADEATGDRLFESQLYLFEAAGFTIACCKGQVTEAVIDETCSYISAVLDPVYADISRNMGRASGDAKLTLQIHHDIMAIGTFSRGFSDGAQQQMKENANVKIRMKNSAEAVIAPLEMLAQFEIIRDAARFTFARMLTSIGSDIFEYIPRLITSLLSNAGPEELVDFLSFIGQLVHLYAKDGAGNILVELIGPLLSNLVDHMTLPKDDNGTSSGTDYFLQVYNLRKAYLHFIQTVVANGLTWVLLREELRSVLESMLQTILEYSEDQSNAVTQKTALAVL
ncbi:hypothetical protein CANCADRAFT_14808, partial [Tortispora caseinolytica NRRL Y-17796]